MNSDQNLVEKQMPLAINILKISCKLYLKANNGGLLADSVSERESTFIQDSVAFPTALSILF